MNWWFAHIICHQCHHNRIIAINHAHSFKVANKVIHTYIEMMHVAFTKLHIIETLQLLMYGVNIRVAPNTTNISRELGRWRGKMTDFHPCGLWFTSWSRPTSCRWNSKQKQTNHTLFRALKNLQKSQGLLLQSLWTHHLDASIPMGNARLLGWLL